MSEPSHQDANGGEIAPREGTLAWLAAQEHVEVLGLVVPSVHRIPDGSTLAIEDGGTACRLIRPDGRRCGAPKTKRYGLCMVHLGGGSDPAKLNQQANIAKAKLRARRELLGIGPSRVGSPRSHARLAALERADALAAALVDGPLDDASLTSIERQRAAALALDQTFPMQTTTLEVELPASEDEAGAMGWAQMQALAAKLLASE